MKLSISNIAWSNHDRILVYKSMKKFGIQGLEIAPAKFFFDTNNFLNPKDSEIKLRLKELDDHGIELVSMQALLYKTSGLKLFGSKTEVKNFENYIIKVINFANKLNIPNLVFGSPDQRFISSDFIRDDAIDIAKKVFFKLGEHAKKSGVVLTIEPIPKQLNTNFLNTFLEVKDFIIDISSNGLRCTLDIGATLLNKDYETLFYESHNLKSIINHVHLSEPFLAPSPRSIRFTKKIFKFLLDIDYLGAVSVEMKPPIKGVPEVQLCLKKLLKVSSYFNFRQS